MLLTGGSYEKNAITYGMPAPFSHCRQIL